MADVVVTPTLDARKLRADFPIFEQRMHGKALAYLDSAASAQKPKVRAFVNATSTQGILFTRSATEGLNLVAYVWGQDNLGPGGVVCVTELTPGAVARKAKGRPRAALRQGPARC